MDPRVLFLVVIFVGFGTFVNVVITNPNAASKKVSSDIAKLLLDCKLSNSVTFIDCLKRLKRHPDVHDIDRNCMVLCMEECTKEEGQNCAESCKHCGTIKYKHHVINITQTEYETECSSRNCTKATAKKDNPVIVNVTNHIHIHNYYNTSTSPTKTSPTIRENGYQQDCPCYFITWFPCYCRPPFSICQYPYEWLCNPYGRFGPIIPGVRPCINSPFNTAIPTIPTIPTIRPISSISNKPTTSSTSTKPTISTISTKPTISTISTKPTISTISNRSTISTISSMPTISAISTKPTISTTPPNIFRTDLVSLRNLDRRAYRQGRWRHSKNSPVAHNVTDIS